MKFISSRVIQHFAETSKTVVIKPRAIPNPSPDPSPDEDDFSRYYNATTNPSSPEDSQPPVKDPVTDRPIGTGYGSDVLIEFNPGVYGDAMEAYRANPNHRQYWVRLWSDRVLLHELVHALSDVSGHNAVSETGPAGYKNLEEFAATVVTNVCVSETGGSIDDLMEYGGQRSPLLLANGQAFYNRYRLYMQNVCMNHRLLARELKAATGIRHNAFIYCDV